MVGAAAGGTGLWQPPLRQAARCRDELAAAAVLAGGGAVGGGESGAVGGDCGDLGLVGGVIGRVGETHRLARGDGLAPTHQLAEKSLSYEQSSQFLHCYDLPQ